VVIYGGLIRQNIHHASTHLSLQSAFDKIYQYAVEFGRFFKLRHVSALSERCEARTRDTLHEMLHSAVALFPVVLAVKHKGRHGDSAQDRQSMKYESRPATAGLHHTVN
jgi:hypothetical protein